MKANRFLPSIPVNRWINYEGSPALAGNTGVIFESGTWSPPVNGVTYEIICIGGGGGGKCYYGAGGGSGYLASANLNLSGSYTVTIGAGGARSTGTGGSAGSGGQTIFGNNLVVANGGSGGVYAGSGGAGGSGGGAVCDRSNARGAWGGGGGGFSGSNGGEARYKLNSTTGGEQPGGAGSQSVPWGKGTDPRIPPGGSGVGIYNYLAGFGYGRKPLDSVMDTPYEGIYGYGKGFAGAFAYATTATARGGGGGGSGWSNDCGPGMPGMIVWRRI